MVPTHGALDVAVQERSGTARITASGELDLFTRAEFEDAVGDALARRPVELLLDLGDVVVIDSTGLAALLAARKRADAAGCRLAVASPAGSEARVLLNMTGTADLLGLRDP
jgi:anti-sigma B factor antagonist